MFRLLIDKYSHGHQDLFLKIDVMPSYFGIADSYFVGDFLGISDAEFENSGLDNESWVRFKAIKLIEYWIERVQTLEKGEKRFIPFDLSDQYVGGFIIETAKRGFKLSYGSTQQLAGYGVTKITLDEQIRDRAVDFINHEKWECFIGTDGFFTGLAWSKVEIMR